MSERQFAKRNGFSSYEALIMSSEIIIQDTSTWLVTLTVNGFLAWSIQSFDKPLGYFDTFELAKQEILDAITLDPSL